MDSTFRQACEEAAERWDVPALAVGTSARGRRDVIALGCDPSTRFRIASVTKPFTATAAVRALDLGAQSGVWPETTIEQLLAHLSGYDCEHGDLARFGDGDDALERLAAELPEVRRWLPSGEVWSYANTGYWLVGWLLARAADRPFEDVLDGLAVEIGLEATSFGEPELPGSGPDAANGPYPRARRPSGGLVSTIVDLLRFAEWHLTRPELTVLSRPLGLCPGGVYGLGLAGERVGEAELWGHGGSYGGFQSSFVVCKDRDAAFAGLTNSGRGKQALREIEDAWLESLLGERRPHGAAISLTAEELAAFEGDFANSESRASVSLGGSGLVVVFDGSLSVEARPVGRNVFEIVGGDYARDRFDFPVPGFARFASRLAERIA